MAAPKIIPYDVELRSVNPVRSFDRPKAYTNDLNSVRFQFKVLDMTSEELATATAVTLVYMRDGSFFANPSTDVSRVGNVFSYLLKENEGNHAGVAQIQLVVTVDGMELASQLFDFEIINGLETKVAQEVMIYDWTTLTRDARAYIDQFVADEMLREAEFDNNEFDRNAAFVASQDARTSAFEAEQTNRGTAFTTEQTDRTTAFNESESGRAAAESDRVTAEEGRVDAETDRVTAEGNRVTDEGNRVTAEGNRVTAESGRVTAENSRVTAETNRAAAFTAFNTRLTAEETATAANKISSVKGKTFSDVDARFEDVEFDTTLMGTNLVTNGNFVNAAGWIPLNSTTAASANELTVTPTSLSVEVGVYRSFPSVPGNLTYISAEVYPKYANSMQVGFYNGNKLPTVPLVPNAWNRLSGRLIPNGQALVLYHNMASSYVLTDTFKLRNIMAIDLTTTFGAGNEPTAEQMDAIMAKFTNSWFDGTKNLFRANATLNKLMAVDARTEFEAKNIVSNGDFSNGTTGWVGQNAAVSSDNSSLNVTGDGTSNAVRAYQTTTEPAVTSQKIYAKASVSVTDSGATDVALQLRTGGRSALIGEVGKTIAPVANTWYEFKNVLTVPSVSNLTYLEPFPQSTYPLASDAAGKVLKVKNVILINLTKAFGAGKEPTLAEMDRLMARYPNSWFDGVKPTQTIETLYQEKANKVQEAWITPTLLNGWTAYDADRTPRYMKDDMGFVHICGCVKSGSNGTIAFTLPVKYRPLGNRGFVGNTNNLPTGLTTLYVDMNGNVVVANSTSNTMVYLDLITFRAEQ